MLFFCRLFRYIKFVINLFVIFVRVLCFFVDVGLKSIFVGKILWIDGCVYFFRVKLLLNENGFLFILLRRN